MDELIKKLDLTDYINDFNALLARPKPLFLEGDSKINLAKIDELSAKELTPPPATQNLNDAIIRLSKQAVLHINELGEFAKIIHYFIYLKQLSFEGKMGAYLDKIVVPSPLLEALKCFKASGEFDDESSAELSALNAAFNNKKSQIAEALRRLISTKSLAPYLVDSQIHFSGDGETLLVRGGFNHALKASVVGRSASGFFYVLPNSVATLKSEQRDILDKKEEILYRYAQNISSVFNKNLPFLRFINSAFDHIDALIARVLMAQRGDLGFILASGDGVIRLKDFCHPALNNPKPVSAELNGSVLLITGVNAGGKSMLLKSILAASFLAKHLLPMRAHNSSKIAQFASIEAIIEDPQNAKNDISTFAGRMKSFSGLFGRKNILVGVDEIELGTDFEEAASLYFVLISRLIASKAKLIITTHHKRLAMLLAKNEAVSLLAALYDEAAARPKYEFLAGTIGKSYAFETAERYGIAANMVAEAKKIYGEDKENLNEIITKTINLEADLKDKISEAKTKNDKLNALLASLKEQKSRADEELKGALNRLEMEFYRAINEAKRATKLSDFKDRQRAINAANELAKSAHRPQISGESEPLKIGERAKYDKIKGEIIAINKNEATILSDGIKLRVPLNLLKRSGPAPKIPAPKPKIQAPVATSGASIIDLHGERADAAIEKLDRFLSNALLIGLDEVWVKHGIGTGKLAWAVREFLKTHPSVKGFRDGDLKNGGFGTTVVRL